MLPTAGPSYRRQGRSNSTLSEYDDTLGIDAMRLKYVLRDIETDCDNALHAALL